MCWFVKMDSLNHQMNTILEVYTYLKIVATLQLLYCYLLNKFIPPSQLKVKFLSKVAPRHRWLPSTANLCTESLGVGEIEDLFQ